MWKALAIALWFPLALAGQPEVLFMPGANSRDTYFTMHNVAAAHVLTTGKGARIGLLDQCFAFEKHRALYAGGADFLDEPKCFAEAEEHGYWMSLTAREIAPAAELYALHTSAREQKRQVDAMVRAIDWAIEHKLDALTYSGPPFSADNRKRLDEAVERAHKNNIITAFIHYSHPGNIRPRPMNPTFDDPGEVDVRVLHYDYSAVIIPRYLVFQQNGFQVASRSLPPFVSMSSTSPVTAAIAALMRSVKPDLSPAECKRILANTSRRMKYRDYDREWDLERVADAAAAVRACLPQP